jgi:hypothetical protein
MEEKKVAGSRIYALIGIIIFGTLAFVMFKNNFDYMTIDYAQLCAEDGGEWHSEEEECILEKEVK